MSARSAVFDLYGDHLGEFDHWAPISAVIAILGATGISAPATRTAVSRMSEQGWLEPDSVDGVRGYRATDPAKTRLTEAAKRIYRRAEPAWDGRWHLTHLEHHSVRTRSDRDRLTAQLGYLGLGRLDTRTWIAPRPIPELPEVLRRCGAASAGQFTADLGAGDSAADLAASVWDLSAIGAAYRSFLTRYAGVLADRKQPEAGDAVQAYRARSALVHDWRKFLFLDPDLPAQVLPDSWPGHAARSAFLRAADAMWPTARIFVRDTMRSRGGADGSHRSGPGSAASG